MHETFITNLIQNAIITDAISDENGQQVSRNIIDHKCKYVVDMSLVLLNYLALEPMTVQLCIAQGLSYDIVAQGQVTLERLFKGNISNEAIPLIQMKQATNNNNNNNDNSTDNAIGACIISISMETPLAHCCEGLDPSQFLEKWK